MPGTTAVDPAPPPPLLHALLARRSFARLVEPGPTPEQLDLLLRAAATAPDHGALRPWRFVVVSGATRARFGDALAAAGLHERPDLSPDLLERLRRKALVAPTMVVVLATPDPTSNVPVWEQEASAACSAFALTLAAHALGLGAMWKSTTMRDGDDLRDLLGMGPHDAMIGWVNVGTVPDGARARGPERPPLAHVATVLTDDGLVPFRG